jgi:hypothetical protein
MSYKCIVERGVAGRLIVSRSSDPAMAQEWSEEVEHDPTAGRADPRCPSCGEKVGARASHCIHCWADLPEDTEYDEVTGGTTEVSHSTDEVTGGSHEISREPDAGESVLGKLRSATRGRGERDQERSREDRERSRRRDRERGRSGDSRKRSRGDDGPPVPSGRGTDGPSLLPRSLLNDAGRAGKFLGGLGVFGAAAIVGFGLPLVVAGVLVAVVAWGGSVVSLARQRSAFDAMRYGSYSLMLTLIFGSFALAFSTGGGETVPLLLALVPVAVSTLLVGGLGYSVAEQTPG